MERKNFCTTVDTDSQGFLLNQEQKILMLGSCFTENIGQRLVENKFHALVNPFGVLYNPVSIFKVLDVMLNQIDSAKFSFQNELFFDGNLWHSWLHSSKFSSPDKETLLEHIHKSITESVQLLRELDVLFLTFGTNHTYFLRQTNQSVTNCHKQPEKLFEERALSVTEIEAFQTVLKRLFKLRPNLQIVFTVSPYRYIKYGLHANQLSKSALLLATDSLKKFCGGQGHYFPAYEIMNDELRDYRFYADDMIHPSALAVDYIWEIFLSSWVCADAQNFIKQWHNIIQDLNHRPINSDSDSYRIFLNKLIQKIMLLGRKYPNLALQKEIHSVQSLLKSCEEQHWAGIETKNIKNKGV
ncbi:MAG: GSCFA domain-containing protein [Bacteroidaceae bacterium]|nr:GSCFA domain-containing protein [Bacteroidaceae bacterium]